MDKDEEEVGSDELRGYFWRWLEDYSEQRKALI
jgi:hypothetical protein